MNSLSKKSNHKYLRYTNLLLLFNLYFFSKNSNIEFILSLLLIITIIASQFFWNNPVKDSIIHKIDAIIAKIVILLFILYTIIYKFKFSYLFILLAILVSFYFSNYYSKQEIIVVCISV